MEELLVSYIAPLILVACLCVGYVIKNVITNQEINRYIPLIVLILGAALNIWFEGAITLPIVVVGMVSGLASTGFYELIDKTILNVKKVCNLPEVEEGTVEEIEEDNKEE